MIEKIIKNRKSVIEGTKVFPAQFDELITVYGDDTVFIFDTSDRVVKRAKVTNLPCYDSNVVKSVVNGIDMSVEREVEQTIAHVFPEEGSSYIDISIDDIITDRKTHSSFFVKSDGLSYLWDHTRPTVGTIENSFTIGERFTDLILTQRRSDLDHREVYFLADSLSPSLFLSVSKTSDSPQEICSLEIEHSQISTYGPVVSLTQTTDPNDVEYREFITRAYADSNYATMAGGLDQVYHDETLTGEGTEDDPLSVVQNEPPMQEVYHDATLVGAGTQDSLLKVSNDFFKSVMIGVDSSVSRAVIQSVEHLFPSDYTSSSIRIKLDDTASPEKTVSLVDVGREKIVLQHTESYDQETVTNSLAMDDRYLKINMSQSLSGTTTSAQISVDNNYPRVTITTRTDSSTANDFCSIAMIPTQIAVSGRMLSATQGADLDNVHEDEFITRAYVDDVNEKLLEEIKNLQKQIKDLQKVKK